MRAGSEIYDIKLFYLKFCNNHISQNKEPTSDSNLLWQTNYRIPKEAKKRRIKITQSHRTTRRKSTNKRWNTQSEEKTTQGWYKSNTGRFPFIRLKGQSSLLLIWEGLESRAKEKPKPTCKKLIQYHHIMELGIDLWAPLIWVEDIKSYTTSTVHLQANASSFDSPLVVCS